MEYRKFPVLVVDDEVENLDAFKLNFSRKFTVRTAGSGAEALEIAKAENFAVAIADQRMPGMLGTDFLAEFRKIRPDAVRMILTGYTDLESVIAAINDGQISRYITKPWEAREIESVVKNGIDHYRRGQERRRRYREVSAYNRVLQLISGERSLSRVVKEVLELIALEFGFARTFLLLGDPQGERPLKGQVVLHGEDGRPRVKKISTPAKGADAPIAQIIAAPGGFSAERFTFSAAPAEKSGSEEGTAEMMEFACGPFYGAPLVVDGRVVGVLAADKGEASGGSPRTDRDDARFIATLAAQIALATGGHLTSESLQRKGSTGGREESSRPTKDPTLRPKQRPSAPRKLDPKNYPVLLVDDDGPTLDVFKLNFGNAFDVLSTRSPKEALEIAKNRQVAVILTDQRMPEMSGIELLSELRDNDPDCVRMILTGYSDIDDIIGAVNRGLVYRYITKPWEQLEVSNALKTAIEYYHELVESRRLLREAEVVNRIMTVVAAESDTDRVVEATLAVAVTDLGYDRAYVFDYDEPSGHLVRGRAAAKEGEGLPSLEKMRIPVIQGGGLLATVALTMQSGRSSEGPHAPGGVEIAVANRKTTLAVPIGTGKPLGVLAAELSRANNRDFSSSDELTLATISEVLSISMTQSRRLAELRALQAGGS